MQKAQQRLKDGEKISLQNKTTPPKKNTLLSWPSGIELDDIECLKANVFFLNQHSVAECLFCPRFTNTIPQQQMQNNINKFGQIHQGEACEKI